MSSYNQFHAIVVDHDLDSRGRLKQAAHAVVNFTKVYPFSNTKDVLSRMAAEHRCDVVFISSRFGQQEIVSFIKEAKQTDVGSDCTYILVLGAASQEGTIIAGNLLTGADGFLFEPYSVDSLKQIAELAAKVKHENQKRREEAALRLLVIELIREVGKMAVRKSCDYPYTKDKKKADNLAQLIKAQCGDKLDHYFELLLDELGGSLPPPNAAYTGASKRVRERMEAKAKQQKLEEIKSS